MSILKKSITGVKWTALGYGVGSLAELVVGILLARILSPSDFGSMAVLSVIVLFASSIVNSGFNQSLLRDPEVTEQDYSTIFVFNLLVSSILFCGISLGSGWISSFYDRPDLGLYLVIFASVLFVQALGYTAYVRLTRQLDFKKLTKINITATLISGGLAITAAVCGWGLWALIVKMMSKEILATFFYYRSIPEKPSFHFSKTLFGKHASFGGFFLFSSFINQIYANFFTMTLGKYFDLRTLGLYNRSEMVRNLFSQNILSVVTNVSYPALAKIQEDIPKLKIGYLLLQSQSFYLVTLAMTVLFVTAAPVIQILLGAQWMESIPLLRILCLQGILLPLTSINMNLFNIVGKPKVYFYFQLCMAILLVIAILWGISYGLLGALWAVLASNFLGMMGSFILVQTLLKTSLHDYVHSYGLTTLLAMLIGLLTFIPTPEHAGLELSIKAGSALGLILFFGHVLKHPAYQNLLHFIKQKNEPS